MLFSALGFFALGEFDMDEEAPIHPIILFPSRGAAHVRIRRPLPNLEEEAILAWWFTHE